MSLEENVVAAAGVVLTSKKMVEADLVKGGDGGVGGDMATDFDLGALINFFRPQAQLFRLIVN